MDQRPPALQIFGLDELDEHELREAVPGESLEILRADDARPPDSGFPEPLTLIAVVVLGSQAISGLAAWLLKKRHRKSVEYRVEIRRPDGSIESRTLKIVMTDSTTDAEVVRQIGESLGIKPESLTAVVEPRQAPG